MNSGSHHFLLSLPGALAAAAFVFAANPSPAQSPAPHVSHTFQLAECEGSFTNHLQGICTDGHDAIFWSWTDALVKTDLRGHVLQRANVAIHHGDLCFLKGRVFVAVNLGKFNLPAGTAQSWVYVYDASTLAELARHPTPEAVHGAGGIAHHAGRFILVGGLPEGVKENYLYEYDSKFSFQKRHVLASGYTLKGIQTAEYAEGAWWFGCYGNPKVLLRSDDRFQLTGRWEFDSSLGLIGLGDGRFLVGQNTRTKGVGNKGRVVAARLDETRGIVLEPPRK